MKVAIIGAGNMGGAIARGLAQGTISPASDVTVADPFSGNLETLQADYPEIRVTTENPKAIEDADIVILAVKPWLIDQILSVIRLEPRQVLVSIAGGVTFEQLVNSVGPEQTIFRLIPKYSYFRTPKHDFDSQSQCQQGAGAINAGYFQ